MLKPHERCSRAAALPAGLVNAKCPAMNVRPVALLVAFLAAACTTARPDAARLVGPAGMLGDDVLAIDQAECAFAAAERTRNDPADAARAVAALDYLAGNLSVSPRWIAVSLITKRQMLEARAETRAALGIAPDAPSQLVVDRMMQAADALTVNDVPAALALVDTPAFTLGPERTLAVLADMPYLRTANIATQYASGEMDPGGGRSF
jgi:hypothetical protein